MRSTQKISTKGLTGPQLRGGLLLGSQLLEQQRDAIDSINVFPEPDWDTATNMLSTMTAANEAASQVSHDTVASIAAAAAQAALDKARGNGGLFLAKFLQGLSQPLANKSQVNDHELTTAIESAVRAAYRAVNYPIEGTMLTVMKDFHIAFRDSVGRGAGLVSAWVFAAEEARESVERTPSLLPLLRERGVVDAGGKAMAVLFDGMSKFLEAQSVYRQRLGLTPSNILIVPMKGTLNAIAVARDTPLAVVTPNGESFVAVPYVQVKTHVLTWHRQLERFNELLNDDSAKEGHFQEFFEENPQFILGVDYTQAIPHPMLIRDTKDPLIPDFLLQPIDSALCDILELKSPTKRIVVGGRPPKLSTSVVGALSQLRQYRDYFEVPEYREAVRKRYGVTAYKPALLVVIGRTPRHVSREQLRQAMQGSADVRLITYDQLRSRMERMAKIMSS